ncbi:apolipoprotein N-acyltransferase [Sphingobium aquiterrae]|uniref:apolipoprotein N-acyltransferase n=1 Tax=Sphingobium aquiterrae TaxID=2038656 RepID=UPI00301A02FA
MRAPKTTALAAGLLSATGFAPLHFWPLTIACLAMLAQLIADAPDRRSAFLRGWLFGLGHFTVGLNWIAHAFTFQDAMPHWFGYGAVVLLSLYLAIYPALAALAAWWGRKRLALPLPGFVLLFAAAWIMAEWLRATLFTGFAWNPMGALWLPSGAAVAATIIGTYGLSGLAILAGGGVLLAIRRHAKAATAIILPLCALIFWGQIATHGAGPAGTIRIRVVQPNIGQQDKYVDAFEERNFQKLATLSGRASDTPRLIFWPEAAVPAYLDMEPEWRFRIAGLLGPNDLLLLGGSKVYFKDKPIALPGGGAYTDRVIAGAANSLWALTPDGRLTGRYDKAHLVPYGEYLPMRALLAPLGLSRLVPGDVDFWPGPGAQSLPLPAAPGRPAMKMGGQICYEIIFSGHVVDAANRPAFIFNPSNDAWFGSWGPPQHLAQARLRAIEEAMPIIRSTPTGISAVVDAQGRVRKSLPHQRAGYIDTLLPPPAGPTPFSRMGNVAPMLLAIMLFGLAVALRRRAR